MTDIYVKNDRETAQMRAACRLAAEALVFAADHVCEGVATASIDEAVHAFIVGRGAVPAPLNYRGFPKSICTSVNDVVCHGIPDEKTRLRDGDIVNVDVTVILDGWHGDTSATFYVGAPSAGTRRLVETARACLAIGIAHVAPGRRIHEIGDAVETHAGAQGCSVVREYVGHGIGRRFHEKPQVPHYADSGEKTRMVAGMTFTIEPMINGGTWRTRLLKDGWTAVTQDGKRSAQFEHTVLVTEGGVEVLTARDRPLRGSEDAA